MSKLQQLETLLLQSPNDPFLHYAIGLELVKKGNLQQAAKGFEQLIQNHPEYIATYYQLGKLYEELNNAPKALEIYRKGIKQAFGKETKTYNELQTAYQNLLLNIEDDLLS
jgi:tetratricopeptide (TPR) repeat protein